MLVHNLIDLMNCASREKCDSNDLFDRDTFFKKSKYVSFLCNTDVCVNYGVGRLDSGVGGLGSGVQSHDFLGGSPNTFGAGLPYFPCDAYKDL